jgi:hypothetical protein
MEASQSKLSQRSSDLAALAAAAQAAGAELQLPNKKAGPDLRGGDRPFGFNPCGSK